jgi:hypothetical protein
MQEIDEPQKNLRGAGGSRVQRLKRTVISGSAFSAAVLVFRSGILDYTQTKAERTRQINRFIPNRPTNYHADG